MYRKVYLEWTIDEDNLLRNIPVGFEVEFSRDRHFHEITTTLTTFDEIDPSGAYHFWYSLDNGNTWIQFPWGDQGYSFSYPFKMRLEINPSDLGYVLSFHNGLLKKVSADSKTVLDSVLFTLEDITDVDQYEDVLYLVGSQTIFKIDGKTLEPYDNSIPLLTDRVVGVAADESRGTLWQINHNSVWLRSLYGDVLWETSIPEIDIDRSSSSSSSSWSSSSSESSSSSSPQSSESVGNTTSSSSSSSESSESIGNTSSSSSSESSMGMPNLYGSGFDAYPQLRGTYHAVDIRIEGITEYYIYRNDNGCTLQHDPYGIIRWKLYIDNNHLALARDHYYKTAETLDPNDGGSNNYEIHMWWDIGNIPISGTTGTIST